MIAVRHLLCSIASALLIVACTQVPEPPGNAEPTQAADAAGPAADAAALSKAIDADRSRMLREFSQVEYEVQKKLLAVSGVEDALGGPHAADLALRQLMREVEILATAPEPQWAPIQNAVRLDGQPDGALGLAAAAVELAGLTRELDKMYGDGTPKHEVGKTEHGRSEIVIKDGQVDYVSEKGGTAGDLAGRFTTLLKVNACPDAEGKVVIDIASQTNLSHVSGSAGANLTVRVQMTRYVNDNAEYDGLDAQTHVESASYGANAASFVDLDTGTSTRDGAANGTTVNRRSDRASDSDVKNAESLGDMLYRLSISYAEFIAGVWRGGACVKLEPTSDPAKRSGVEPSTSFSISAAPRSKIDGAATGGTVKATLAGGSSLSPNGTPVKADATFTYVAPEEKEKDAKVSFEARSRRGIGKAELAFDTREKKQAYDIAGGADEFHGSGVACDLGARFFIEGSGVTVRFEPSSAQGGRYSYSGNMSGFQVWGNGTYTVSYQGDVAVSLQAEGPGSVKTPKGTFTRSGSETYTLTPHEGACE
jgi:hypothetical protein